MLEGVFVGAHEVRFSLRDLLCGQTTYLRSTESCVWVGLNSILHYDNSTGHPGIFFVQIMFDITFIWDVDLWLVTALQCAIWKLCRCVFL